MKNWQKQNPVANVAYTKEHKMILFQIFTGAIGNSSVCAYAWAATQERALEEFYAKNPKYSKDRSIAVVKLFDSDDSPFATKLSDETEWEF